MRGAHAQCCAQLTPQRAPRAGPAPLPRPAAQPLRDPRRARKRSEETVRASGVPRRRPARDERRPRARGWPAAREVVHGRSLCLRGPRAAGVPATRQKTAKHVSRASPRRPGGDAVGQSLVRRCTGTSSCTYDGSRWRRVDDARSVAGGRPSLTGQCNGVPAAALIFCEASPTACKTVICFSQHHLILHREAKLDSSSLHASRRRCACGAPPFFSFSAALSALPPTCVPSLPIVKTRANTPRGGQKQTLSLFFSSFLAARGRVRTRSAAADAENLPPRGKIGL